MRVSVPVPRAVPVASPRTVVGPSGTVAVNHSGKQPVTLVVTTSNAGCLPAWFDATVPSGTTTVPAYVTSHPLGTGTLTFNDDPAVNQDACKGATITVSVSSN